MNRQIDKSKGPGVYIPPPLLYALIFVVALLIQKKIPLEDSLFRMPVMKITGAVFLSVALVFLIRSLRQFFQTKNTVVLIKPATSLQKSGVYSISRNPMYLGLAFLYLGISCCIGNWWHLILFPLLIIIMQEYVIKREEKYLEVEFGEEYQHYKNKVRRWL